MITTYYQFPDEATFKTVIWPDNIIIDIIGPLFTDLEYDEFGEIKKYPVQRPGYCVNIYHEPGIELTEDFRIPEPNSPKRKLYEI